MPWTMQKPPNPAKNWPDSEKRACVRAANAVLADGGTDQEAIRACLGAGARVKENSSSPPGGDPMEARIVDLFMADKVLAGDPVRLLPILEEGYWRFGQLQPPITPEKAQTLVVNFEQRAKTGTHQTNLPLNIEHDDRGGKIGTIASLSLQEDGVYATFDLTDKGEKLLAEDSFDYLSPEIDWNLVDTRSGETVGAFLVGVAATNYPFFGDATAMFSSEAGEHLSAPAPGEALGHLPAEQIFAAIKAAIQTALKATLGNDPANPEEENPMSDQDDARGEMQVPEEFTTRLAEMETQIEQFTTTLAARDGQIAERDQVIEGQRDRLTALEQSRQRERFSRQVDNLAHVGAQNESLVEELMWLHQADGSDEREHFAFWSTLLSTMESAVSDSAAFQETGQAGHKYAGASAMSRFSSLVQEMAGKQNLVVTEGDANWARLAEEAAEANPDLYTQHINQVRAQGQNRPVA